MYRGRLVAKELLQCARTGLRITNIVKPKYCSTADEIERDLPPPPPSPVASPPGPGPVCAYNEWDPLEEVLLGRPEGIVVPRVGPEIKATIRPEFRSWFYENAGKPVDAELTKQVKKEVDEFQRVLELEGVTVRRPELFDYTQMGEFKTPDFTEHGFSTMFPRDAITAIGNELIEGTMSWRCRYFDTHPWKKILCEYFRQGARWTQAPKPSMGDHMYDPDYPYDDDEALNKLAAKGKYVLTEAEPAFDTADLIRCGKDIFVQLSEVTNWSGVEWLRRHLAATHRVHPLNILDGRAMHVDMHFVPLRPGFIMANPDVPCLQVNFFRENGWEVVYAPKPLGPNAKITEHWQDMYTSQWMSMNVISLDEERVVVYNKDETMMNWLKKHGFKPIGVDFTNVFGLGGAFHCWTVDVRRKGELKSYFDKV